MKKLLFNDGSQARSIANKNNNLVTILVAMHVLDRNILFITKLSDWLYYFASALIS